MILAVTDYVEGEIDAPPIELKYALQAKNFGALPNDGGLRNQPVGLMIRMSAALNVFQAFSAFKSAGFDPKWIKNNSESWNIISEVAILRKNIDDRKNM